MLCKLQSAESTLLVMLACFAGFHKGMHVGVLPSQSGGVSNCLWRNCLSRSQMPRVKANCAHLWPESRSTCPLTSLLLFSLLPSLSLYCRCSQCLTPHPPCLLTHGTQPCALLSPYPPVPPLPGSPPIACLSLPHSPSQSLWSRVQILQILHPDQEGAVSWPVCPGCFPLWAISSLPW